MPRYDTRTFPPGEVTVCCFHCPAFVDVVGLEVEVVPAPDVVVVDEVPEVVDVVRRRVVEVVAGVLLDGDASDEVAEAGWDVTEPDASGAEVSGATSGTRGWSET